MALKKCLNWEAYVSTFLLAIISFHQASDTGWDLTGKYSSQNTHVGEETTTC